MDRSGLRVLIFQRLRGFWVARGLEHDLSVEGRTPASVIDRIHRLVRAHVEFDRRHGRVPLSPFPAAPPHIWRAFEHATRLPTWKSDCRPVGSDLPPITVAVAPELPARTIARPTFRPSPSPLHHAGQIAEGQGPVH